VVDPWQMREICLFSKANLGLVHTLSPIHHILVALPAAVSDQAQSCPLFCINCESLECMEHYTSNPLQTFMASKLTIFTCTSSMMYSN